MNHQNKSSILQLLVPTSVMMIVVIAMLFGYYQKGKREAQTNVSKTLTASVESYASRFLNELEKVGQAGAPMSRLMAAEGVEDSARVGALLSVAADCAGVDKALFVNAQGVGVNQDGEPVAIGRAPFFGLLRSSEFSYIYAAAEKCIIVMNRISSEKAQGYLLLYYPVGHFLDTLLKSGYDSNSFLALVDMDGTVMGVSGAVEDECVQGGNLLAAVDAVDKEAAKSVRNRLNNGSHGTETVVNGERGHMLAFVPLGANHWNLALGVSSAYVQRQVAYQCRGIGTMVISLLMVIGVFFIFVIVANIVGRYRSNEKKKELEEKADTDQLTGLSNKLATERKIKEYMEQNPKKQCMMFLFDIDNFKKINDTMGHAFGDEVLRSLGMQIGGIFRASDVVGRIGGDEFMVFLKDISNNETIMKEARKVETFFKGFQAGEYVKYKATASIGVAIFPHEGKDFETLYKAADQGLYKAKKRGKKQLAFYRDRNPDGTLAAENEAVEEAPGK